MFRRIFLNFVKLRKGNNLEKRKQRILRSGRRPGIRLHLRGLLRVRGGADAAASAAPDDVAAAAPILAEHEGPPEFLAQHERPPEFLAEREHEGTPESASRTREEPFFRG